MKHYIFLTLFFWASLAHGQVVTITQSGSGAGIDTSYQVGDSVFIVSGGDTIFSGLAGVDVAPSGPNKGLRRISNDSLGLDLENLGSPLVITGTDRFTAWDPEGNANVGISWTQMVDQMRDSSSSSFTNGLQSIGGSGGLGGTMTQNTTITGAGFDYLMPGIDSFYLDFDGIRLDLDGAKFLHTTGGGGGSGINENMFMGYQAGTSFSGTGYANTVYGRRAAYNLAGTAPNASSNAIFGYGACESCTTAAFNSIFGVAAGGNMLATVSGNVAVGHHALLSNQGSSCVGIGRNALDHNTRDNITGVGYNALTNNQGLYNSALGYNSAGANTTGDKGTHVGWGAGQNSTTATEETNLGYLAGGTGISTVGYNTNLGSGAGKSQTSANTNTNVGREAGSSNLTGNSSVRVGNNAGNTGTDNSSCVLIGNAVLASSTTADNEMNIGNVFFGEDLYNSGRMGIGKRPNDLSVLDLGASIRTMILPKGTTAQEPGTAKERGMIRFDTDKNQMMQYDTASGGFVQVSKMVVTDTTKSAGGVTIGAKTQSVVYDCSAGNITQSFSQSASAAKNWEFTMTCINCSTNSVSVTSISNGYVDGVSASSTTIKNGEVLNFRSNGLNWFITKSIPKVVNISVSNSGIINMTLPTYADDAAAGAGGLVTGDLYKTATGEVRIKI